MNPTQSKEVNRQVVRLRTSAWRSGGAIHVKRSLITLARKSSGVMLLDEEASATSPDEAIETIVNLSRCSDGVYQVIACNQKTDWETGICDSYDLKLVPFKE